MSTTKPQIGYRFGTVDEYSPLSNLKSYAKNFKLQITFDGGLTALADELGSAWPRNAAVRRGKGASRKTSSSDPDWTLGHSYQECRGFLAHGWEEGRNTIEIVSSDTMPQPVRLKKKIAKTKVAGQRPHIARAASGSPKAMRRKKRVYREKVVRIAVNLAASATVRASETMKRGAAILSLVHALEESGVRVELDVIAATEGERSSKDSLVYRIRVKRAKDPLVLQELAFALAHPGMLRRITFELRERLPTPIANAFGVHASGEGGYGTPAYIPAPLAKEYDCVFERMYGAWTFDGATPQEWLDRHYREILGKKQWADGGAARNVGGHRLGSVRPR